MNLADQIAAIVEQQVDLLLKRSKKSRLDNMEISALKDLATVAMSLNVGGRRKYSKGYQKGKRMSNEDLIERAEPDASVEEG